MEEYEEVQREREEEFYDTEYVIKPEMATKIQKWWRKTNPKHTDNTFKDPKMLISFEIVRLWWRRQLLACDKNVWKAQKNPLKGGKELFRKPKKLRAAIRKIYKRWNSEKNLSTTILNLILIHIFMTNLVHMLNLYRQQLIHVGMILLNCIVYHGRINTLILGLCIGFQKQYCRQISMISLIQIQIRYTIVVFVGLSIGIFVIETSNLNRSCGNITLISLRQWKI